MANKMRVWWIPQVPGKPFHVETDSVSDAKRLLHVLAQYDLFQYENKIKGDYANAGGLEVFEDGEWIEWADDEGDDINAHLRDERWVHDQS